MDEGLQGGNVHQGVHHEGHTSGGTVQSSQHHSSDDTVSFKMKATTLWKSVAGVLLVLLVASVLTNGFSFGPTGAAVVPTGGGGAVVPSTPAGPVTFDLEGAPVLGSPDAPVTVVEFSDFSCPFCAAASGDNAQLTAYMKQRDSSWEPIVTNLIKDYVDTGKVKLVAKFSFGHSGGKPAQLVAWCLNEQDPALYWKFHPEAFATYDLNAQDQPVEDAVAMSALAKKLGADMTKLQSCLDSKKFDNQFDAEIAEGRDAGVQGTPAFFVNGIELPGGAQPYSVMKAAVERALAAS